MLARDFSLDEVVWPVCITTLEMGEESAPTEGVPDMPEGNGGGGGTGSAHRDDNFGTVGRCGGGRGGSATYSCPQRLRPHHRQVSRPEQQQQERRKAKAASAFESATLLSWAMKESGTCVDRPIREVSFPGTLLLLELLGSFNEPLDGVNWPPARETLVLGELLTRV